MPNVPCRRPPPFALGCAFALVLALPVPSGPAAAHSPEVSVTPVPAAPESGDAFVLEIESVCCSSPARVVDTSARLVDGVIRVETATDCGPLSAATGYEYSVVVPPLPPGDYSVEVYSQGACNAGDRTLEITDSLTVEARGALSGTRCTPGVEPAATLLFPYFEVDTESVEGITTLLAITNTLAEPVLAKVFLWSDWALPVGSFHVYLTGYDVQTLNLRDVLAGRLPATGPGPSPQGGEATPATTPPGCDPQDVTGADYDPALLTAALRGDGSLPECWSSDAHPESAVGYVTVDVVDRCSDLGPGSAGYFGYASDRVASNRNALLGDFILAETGESFAQGAPAIHLVADASAFGPGDPTFYALYVGTDGSDARMPLGRLHGVRYVENPGFDGGTEILVWRDAAEPAHGPRQCDDLPGPPYVPWLDRFATVDAFDEEENRTTAQLASFPWATQRVPVSALSPYDSGWLRLDLHRQAATLAVMRALGRFSVGTWGGQLDDACAALD